MLPTNLLTADDTPSSEIEVIPILATPSTSTQPAAVDLLPLIHRLPVELLRQIFEAAVSLNQRGFKAATAISHVSRSWRVVALETPTLWAYLEISMDGSQEEMDIFWLRMASRARAIPVTVVLLNINDDESAIKTNLLFFIIYSSEITSIESLTLEGDAATLLDSLHASSDNPSTKPLSRLVLHVRGFDVNQDWVTAVLANFPFVRELVIVVPFGDYLAFGLLSFFIRIFTWTFTSQRLGSAFRI